MYEVEALAHCQQVNLDSPIFFENTVYQVEWIFLQKVKVARLHHRSKTVCRSFNFTPSEGEVNARLTGTINTGNDLGWLRLSLTFELDGKTYNQHIAFEVLPIKMDLHQDIHTMYQAIDTVYPLWRFSLVEKTEQDVKASQQGGHFPLMWLANFSALRARFEQGLKVICAAPHSRLQPTVATIKAAKLKGRLPRKLAEQVKQDLSNGQYDKRYSIEKKQLSVDTPENRFIKMVVTRSKRKLAEFEKKLVQSNKAPEYQRLSDSFLNELHSWQQPLQKVLSQSFFKEVGAYKELRHESLVLQQKTGYSAVYRVWQELKFYLDVLDSQSTISMKPVADIYEVWCFLCLKHILENELGFGEPKNNAPTLPKEVLEERKLKKGNEGCFEFLRKADGIKARLYHEKEYGRETQEIRSFLLTHKPDIVLEVELPDGQKFIWLFDAKYRISDIKVNCENQFIGKPTEEELKEWLNKTTEQREKLKYSISDGVPDDAINQMHRYRDALISMSGSSSSTIGLSPQKSRPVFGAFALYPGVFEQEQEQNPYTTAIKEVGIGAFALLPSSNRSDEQSRNSGYKWLLDFLGELIGTVPNTRTEQSNEEVYPVSKIAERLYIREAARIPYSGMQQSLYPDLTLIVSSGRTEGLGKSYCKASISDESRLYYLQQKTLIDKFNQHIVEEIRYLAIATISEQNNTTKSIDMLWPVNKVSVVPINKILPDQAGKKLAPSDLYYLFELGQPLKLHQAVGQVPHSPLKKYR